jgi:hypothetical protein
VKLRRPARLAAMSWVARPMPARSKLPSRRSQAPPPMAPCPTTKLFHRHSRRYSDLRLRPRVNSHGSSCVDGHQSQLYTRCTSTGPARSGSALADQPRVAGRAMRLAALAAARSGVTSALQREQQETRGQSVRDGRRKADDHPGRARGQGGDGSAPEEAPETGAPKGAADQLVLRPALDSFWIARSHGLHVAEYAS